MRFMMSSQLTEEIVFQRCRKAHFSGDHNGMRRCYLLMLMLCKSAEGRMFRDPEDMADVLNDTPKQCRMVWNICIEENVLIPGDGGYSAAPWLERNKMTV